MSAVDICIIASCATSVRIPLMVTVLPCQGGAWKSKSFVDDMRYQRTRSPFRSVSAYSGMLPCTKPLMENLTYHGYPLWRIDGLGLGPRARRESLREEFCLASQLSYSCTCMNDATISRSTSLGEPSARALPRAVMIIGPNSPVLMSRTSST